MAIKQLQLQNPLPEYETNHTQQFFATPNKVREYLSSNEQESTCYCAETAK